MYLPFGIEVPAPPLPCGCKFCPKVFLFLGLYNIAFVVLGIFISAIFVYVSLFQCLED